MNLPNSRSGDETLAQFGDRIGAAEATKREIDGDKRLRDFEEREGENGAWGLNK